MQRKSGFWGRGGGRGFDRKCQPKRSFYDQRVGCVERFTREVERSAPGIGYETDAPTRLQQIHGAYLGGLESRLLFSPAQTLDVLRACASRSNKDKVLLNAMLLRGTTGTLRANKTKCTAVVAQPNQRRRKKKLCAVNTATVSSLFRLR